LPFARSPPGLSPGRAPKPPLTNFGRDIRATDGAEIEKAAFIDLMDDEANLIHVAREHRVEAPGLIMAVTLPSTSVVTLWAKG
jgi:hypothetical protein